MSGSDERSPVSVVICTHLYARRSYLEEALTSVVTQSLVPREIVVVVDGDVMLADYLETRALEAELVILPRRSGLSAARNAGASRVTAPLVAFLDDDATAEPDWLETLVAGFSSDDIVGVGGWSQPRWECPRPGWFPEQLLWVVGCSYEGLPLDRSVVRNVFGGCACYRKAVFDEVGGFREDLGRKAKGAEGAEETEFCLRVKEQDPGRQLIFEPSARIHHRVPASRASLAYIARRSWHEGRSKALMASSHGRASLGDERHYVISQVLRAALRDVANLRTQPRERALHALALLLAVGCAGLGFMFGSFRPRFRRSAEPSSGTERKRVAVVAARQFPHIGGIETHVHEVNSRLVQAAWDITSIAGDASVTPAAIDAYYSYPVHRHRAYPPGRDWIISPGTAIEVFRGRFDLVHCQGVHTAVAPLAMLAALASRTPYIVTFHTGGHSSAIRNRGRKVQWAALRPLLRRAAALVAVCEWEVELFARELRLDRDAFTLIRNGAEPLAVAGTPEHPRPEELLILSIGRLEHYKGHGRAIAAMPHLLARRPARLVIVGRGPYEASLRSQVESLGLVENVEFAYFASEQRAELGALVARADATVLLSDYEAHPVAVMEALSVRCPVLVAETSGLTELARAGWVESVAVSAHPAEVAEAIERAAASRPPAIALPSWDDCARAVTDVYNLALDPNAGGRRVAAL